jgi:hypothetical protein
MEDHQYAYAGQSSGSLVYQFKGDRCINYQKDQDWYQSTRMLSGMFHDELQ